jgi:hypothetical protein
MSVRIRVIQQPTRDGADPLDTDKYLDIILESPCSLELLLKPKEKLGWLQKLLWWKYMPTGIRGLDHDYAVSSSNRHRAHHLLAHKKVKSQLLQLIPCEFLSISRDDVHLRYLITSHHIFLARHLAEVLRRMLRLSRLCQNLS